MEQRGDGWIVFAAIVLGVAGVVRAFDAIWAFRYHGVLPQNLENAIFGSSLKTYGWVYLIVAAILIVCAFGVIVRSPSSAVWIGIFAGVVLSISAIWWMPSIQSGRGVHLVGILVIYGLAVYGTRRRRNSPRKSTEATPWQSGGSLPLNV